MTAPPVTIVPAARLESEILSLAESPGNGSGTLGAALPLSPPLRVGERGESNSDSGIEVIRAWEESEPGPVEYRIDAIVPSGHITGMFADGGEGKGFVGVAMGCHVSAGESFFGLKVRQGSVFVLDAENLGREEFLRRAYKVSRGMGLQTPPEGLYYVELHDSLMSDSVFDACERITREANAGLVIVDSFAAASAASDQIAANEIVSFMKRLKRLGTVLVIDHIPKPTHGQQSPTMRPFGSTFKYNLVRSSLRLERGDSGAMRLTQIKHNLGKLADPIAFAMSFGFDSVTFEQINHDDDRLGDLHAVRQPPLPQRILNELAQFGEDGAMPEQVGTALGIGKKTVANRLSGLHRNGKVKPLGGGRWKAVDNVESPSQSLGKESGESGEGLWK